MSNPGAFVSSRDYRDGFGSSTAGEVMDLRKALDVGNDINNPGTSPGEGFPLRTESLESTLKNLTFEMDEIKLFKAIPKTPASNTVEEFNRLISYSRGGARAFDLGWMNSGDLPEEEDSTYERVQMLIKYLGVVGRVTHVSNVIRPAHGNVIAMETMNKTMFMLQQLENALFFGNASLNPMQIDGLYRLIETGAPDNIVDARGASMTEERLNLALLQIRDNLGQATDVYSDTGVFADFANSVYDRQRFQMATGTPGTLGAQINAFQGQHGKVNLHDSIFIQPGGLAVEAGLGKASKRPLPPTITVAPADGVNALSQFSTAELGAYIYRVVARNEFGATAPVTTAAVTVGAGDSVTFTIADGGQGTTYYEIYRSTVGGAAGTAKLMTKVARTGATQVITDHNADIPGTSTVFVLMQNQRSFAWSQLLPMTRIPLAAIDTSIRWAQVLYGGIKMYSPAKNLIIKNVGRA